MLNSEELQFYDKQLRLPEIGMTGQQRLKGSRVLVVGAGGLGSSALLYLAGAGVGTIGICEPDVLEASNLHRQVLYKIEDLAQPKLLLAKQALEALNPHITLQLHPDRITPDNSVGLISDYDLVLDCTDNFSAKFLIHDTAMLLRKPWVLASIYQYEGQLLSFSPTAFGKAGNSGCLRCLWPEIPDDRCIGSCAEVGVLGAVPGVFGTFQAMEAIQLLLDPNQSEPCASANNLLLFDLKTWNLQKITRFRNPECPVCGNSPKITTIAAKNYGEPEESPNWEVSVSGFEENALKAYQWVDIREVDEAAKRPLPKSVTTAFKPLHLPLSTFSIEDLPEPDRPVLLFCEKGIRSQRLAEILRQEGFKNIYSGAGGLQRIFSLQGRQG